MIVLLKNNLANIFTLTRIVLAIWLIFLMLYDNQLMIAFFLTLTCIILDVLDGWMARRLDIQTNFGAFLDRLADKIFICPIIIILAWHQQPEINPMFNLLTKSLVVTIVLLEGILMTSGVLGAIKKLDISSNKWGKIKMILESITILVWLLMIIVDNYSSPQKLIYLFYPLITPLLIGVVIFATKSLEGYWKRYRI